VPKIGPLRPSEFSDTRACARQTNTELQLSLDGRRLYVSNSLLSTWDNQFYPGLRSWLLRVNCGPDGGMEVDRDFFVDLHDRPGGPARAHEVRLQNGDCTTEIFQ
jgi:selenium-binding protein 1